VTGALPLLLVLFSPLTQLSFIPISVGVGEDIGMSQAQVGIAIGAHSLATGAASLLAGPLLDLLPIRRVLLPSVLVSALVSVWLCFHVTFESLAIGRTLSGLSTGAVMLCAFALVTDMSRGDERARDRRFSLLQTFMATGAATALGLGAAAAQLDVPWIVFVASAVYSVVLMVLVIVMPAPPRPDPMEVDSGASRVWFARLAAILRGVGLMVTQPRMIWLLVCACVLGLVIQGAHYGVSVLMETSEGIALWQRVALSILIPLGVFTGSSINRRALKRVGREKLYTVFYLLLPVAVLAYACLTAFGAALAVVAVGLLCVGTCLGAMMPLSAAIAVGWFVELRGSATAAESLARSVGQTAGPVLVGIVVAAASVEWAAFVIAAAAVLGSLASLMLGHTSRRKLTRDAVHPGSNVGSR
jgi:MFS transporter, DHA1 family, multidrug resistance protein